MLLIRVSSPVAAQDVDPNCVWIATHDPDALEDCNGTYAAYQTSTPGTPTPTLGTPGFLDLLGGTATPTPGINPACPASYFDPTNLDPQWSLVCSACIATEVPSATPVFGSSVLFPNETMEVASFPTISLDTQTPVLTPSPSLTPSLTLTPTNTPAGTLTPTPTNTPNPNTEVDIDFRPGVIGSADSYAGTSATWVSGQGWQSHAGNSGYYYAQVNIDLRSIGIDHMDMLSMGYLISSPYYTGYYRAQRINGQTGFEGFTLVGAAAGTFDYYPNGGFGSISWIEAGVQEIKIQMQSQGGVGTWGVLRLYGKPTYLNPTGTPTPSQTPTPSNTPTPTGTPAPTQTPIWWATSWSPFQGWSVDCSVPKHIDTSTPIAAFSAAPSGTSTCLTILPDLDIGFGAVNFVTQTVLHFSIPDLVIEQTQVCFVGVSLDISFLGFEIDMSIVVGAPLLAFIFRWIMRN